MAITTIERMSGDGLFVMTPVSLTFGASNFEDWAFSVYWTNPALCIKRTKRRAVVNGHHKVATIVPFTQL